MDTIRERDDPAAVIAGWCDRPAASGQNATANALTIDVEDYFQVEAFFGVIERASWDAYVCRIERNIDRILELCARAAPAEPSSPSPGLPSATRR